MNTPEILFTRLNLTIVVMYSTVSFRWNKLRLLLSSVRKERPNAFELVHVAACRSHVTPQMMVTACGMDLPYLLTRPAVAATFPALR